MSHPADHPTFGVQSPSVRNAAPGHQRVGVTRSDRACTDCRRLKVRCMRDGDQPCRRCQHIGQECIVTVRAKERCSTRGSGSSLKRRRSIGGAPVGPDLNEEQVVVVSDVLGAANRRMLDLEQQLELLRSEMSVLTGGEGSKSKAKPANMGEGQEQEAPNTPQSAIQSYPASATRNTLQFLPTGSGTHVVDPIQGITNDEECRKSAPPFAARAVDLLASDHLVAPFRQLKSMADENDGSRPVSRAASYDHLREPLRETRPSGSSMSTIYRGMPDQAQTALVSVLHNAITSSRETAPDIVDLGLLGEDEARQLCENYFTNCSDYVLVHDAKLDTWETMRSRSPIALASVIAIGAMARDGTGAVSDAQRNALQFTKALVMGSIFTRHHCLGDVQGVITIGAYHRNCWLLSGHAIRLATDLGLDTAFEKLLASGMGASMTAAQEEQDRDLIIRARLWFALYAHEHQLSFGNGRCPTIREDESLAQCRQFLNHPFSIASDVRLIAIVELLMLRTPLHLQLTNTSAPVLGQDFVNMLQKMKVDLIDWYNHYDGLMCDRLKMEPTSYYRESLRTQREYASLFSNSLLLRGVSRTSDLRQLSDDEYVLALSAVRSAHVCLDITTRGESYPRMLKFAIPHTHMSVAFAACFLLRTARLFPDRFDRVSIARDVETLTSMLADCGAGRLSRALGVMLVRAREGDSKDATRPHTTAIKDGSRDTMQSLPLDQDVVDFDTLDMDLNVAFDSTSATDNPLASNGFNFPFEEFWDTSDNGMFMTNLLQRIPESVPLDH
ncbi:hypothetical protein BCR39DRAFT_528194 [Naematelia encephala]|uniref:Zn(2)-C6 fungal-type domain-containing protein n=1 Tax=Naematelia encephala TaxID=71784 RepID=A0A1Y2B7E7_9TREE|nr:hypothetical protein BCR39DRAFT_528194 [Naematelia encephala]